VFRKPTLQFAIYSNQEHWKELFTLVGYLLLLSLIKISFYSVIPYQFCQIAHLDTGIAYTFLKSTHSEIIIHQFAKNNKHVYLHDDSYNESFLPSLNSFLQNFLMWNSFSTYMKYVTHFNCIN